MGNDTLDLTPLERAIARLREGWVRYQQDIADTQIRDGLIQRFAFTYEISHKMPATGPRGVNIATCVRGRATRIRRTWHFR